MRSPRFLGAAGGPPSSWKANPATPNALRDGQTKQQSQAGSRSSPSGNQGEKGILKARCTSARQAAKLLEGTLGNEPAACDDADAIGHPFRNFQNARRHNDSAAALDALAKHILHLACGSCI